VTRTENGIAKVLEDLGIIRSGTIIKIRRTHAGRHMLASGAWSWRAVACNGEEVAGSRWNCQEIISAHKDGRVVTYKEDFEFTPELQVKRKEG